MRSASEPVCDFFGLQDDLTSRRSREKVRQGSLPLGEGAFHLPTHEQRIRNSSGKTEANFVVDQIADERSRSSVSRFGQKLVTVMPLLERSFILHVGEVMFPSELRDARDPLRPNRQEWKDSKRRHDRGTYTGRFIIHTPAGGAGGGIRFTAINFVSLAAGMMRGRFSGFEKKANTVESGKGTHCSNSRWLGTLESA